MQEISWTWKLQQHKVQRVNQTQNTLEREKNTQKGLKPHHEIDFPGKFEFRHKITILNTIAIKSHLQRDIIAESS